MHNFLRGMRWWVAMAVIAVGLRAADPLEVLAGSWSVTENFRAVDSPGNATMMQITRVIAQESSWADGMFDLQWQGQSSPTRGYFSTKTGRVWIKTLRQVEGRSASVEYNGSLSVTPEGIVVWEGLASTDGRRLSWSFSAQRLAF